MNFQTSRLSKVIRHTDRQTYRRDQNYIPRRFTGGQKCSRLLMESDGSSTRRRWIRAITGRSRTCRRCRCMQSRRCAVQSPTPVASSSSNCPSTTTPLPNKLLVQKASFYFSQSFLLYVAIVFAEYTWRVIIVGMA